MQELIKVNYSDESVLGRDIFAFIFDGKESGVPYSTWFARAVKRFDFREGEDFQTFLQESTGGRPKIGHVCTIDMGKELCMVSATERGKKARKYFLRCEKIVKKLHEDTLQSRLLGKETRKNLTDELRDSGENDRMHGHGYSTYTRLAYKLTGLPKGERDNLKPEDLDRLETVEGLMHGLLKAGQSYDGIKSSLMPIFEKKEINHD